MQLCSKVMECDWKKCQRNWFFFSIYTYLELLFLYFLYFIHSFFLFNIFIKEFTIFVQSLSLHKSFSIKLVWGAQKICPKNLIEIKDSFWGQQNIYLWMAITFFSPKNPHQISIHAWPCQYSTTTHLSPFFLSRCPSEK